jgi:hypothetical protein
LYPICWIMRTFMSNSIFAHILNSMKMESINGAISCLQTLLEGEA